MLLAKIVGNGVLRNADIDGVNSEKGEQGKALSLYTIVQTKPDAYSTVEGILRKERRTGAADIFWKLPGFKTNTISTQSDYGLTATKCAPRPISLILVDVTATVVHAVAKVRVTQVYQNSANHPIEAIYHFPTNPEGAITHFQAELEGRIIKGNVRSKEDAQNIYKSAVESGKLAVLGEEIKPDIFKVWVGSIQPRAGVKVYEK